MAAAERRDAAAVGADPKARVEEAIALDMSAGLYY